VLYATDVAARSPRLRAIELPAGTEVTATYVACATMSAKDPARAAPWVRELWAPSTVALMRDAGFSAHRWLIPDWRACGGRSGRMPGDARMRSRYR